MGQNPVPPVNIPIPTKIGSKMGREFTYPKMGSQHGFGPPQPSEVFFRGKPIFFDHHAQHLTWVLARSRSQSSAGSQRGAQSIFFLGSNLWVGLKIGACHRSWASLFPKKQIVIYVYIYIHMYRYIHVCVRMSAKANN